MQTEQQNVTSQTKKPSSGVKKGKSTTPSKVKETEPIVEQVLEKKVIEQVVETSSNVQSETTITDNNVTIQEVELNNILEYLNVASDRLLDFSKYFKDNILSKDERSKLETSFKKFSKANSSLQQTYYEYLSKQVSSLEKNSGNKSGGNKKVTDKDKSAIHKKHQVHPFLLEFMKREQNTLVSRSEALTAITSYVKQEKIKNPSIIVENDKMKFKLIGDLKPLFDGIEKVMKTKNLLNEKVMPIEIKYTQIMEYMTHCFIKAEPPAVVV